MQTRVSRWGNSLAVRIPSALASDLELAEGDEMGVTVEQGTLVLRPARPRYSLEDLVSGITPDNRRAESNWGAATGMEEW